MARTATLPHRAELLDEHMCDSNWKKLLGMGTKSLFSPAALASNLQRCAGTDANIREEWEVEIEQAEQTRRLDQKAMDIMKTWHVQTGMTDTTGTHDGDGQTGLSQTG
ncbi:hypothetical protein C0991_012297 [Blastosporella zonata]|nr:hypothetical protein C0991_012297 [Blastosporella zonata]